MNVHKTFLIIIIYNECFYFWKEGIYKSLDKYNLTKEH